MVDVEDIAGLWGGFLVTFCTSLYQFIMERILGRVQRADTNRKERECVCVVLKRDKVY